MSAQITLPDPELATAPNLAGQKWYITDPSSWDTPRTLLIMAVVVALVGTFFYLSIASATSECKHAVVSIGTQCAPSIISAKRIAVALADFDTNMGDALISPPGSGDMKNGAEAQQRRHAEITENLVKAAQNINFGEEERVPIETIADNLGRYETTMERAKMLSETEHPDDSIAAARTAFDLMHDVLLPAAENLDKENRSVLDTTFTSHQNVDVLELLGLIVVGLFLLGMLCFAQLYMFRKMNRIVNPGLALATLITLLLMADVCMTLINTDAILRTAVNDAFDSVQFLWNARAISYDANGDEARWLLDRANAGKYADQFFNKSRSLAEYQGRSLEDLPNGITPRQIADMAADNTANATDLRGYLVYELKNITYPGERDAATAMLNSYGEYLQADNKVRQLENDGYYARAVSFRIGSPNAGSNYLFSQYDQALGRALDINREAFDKDISKALDQLGPLTYIVPVSVALIIVLSILGFRERIKEYSI